MADKQPGAQARDLDSGEIELCEYLMPQAPESYVVVKVMGEGLREAGIRHGDLLVVDKVTAPGDGSIVLAASKGELVVRRRCQCSNLRLVSPSDRNDETHPRRLGVVRWIIRAVGADFSFWP